MRVVGVNTNLQFKIVNFSCLFTNHMFVLNPFKKIRNVLKRFSQCGVNRKAEEKSCLELPESICRLEKSLFLQKDVLLTQRTRF